MKTILIAGCGGNLGISIARILRMSRSNFQLIGTDIHSQHPGSAIYDHCCIIPPVSSRDYITSLCTVIAAYDVQAIIPISANEIDFFSSQQNRCKLEGHPLVMANEKALTTGRDKYETAMFLKEKGLPYPWTVLIGQGDPLTFPCILKPRIGSGGKGFRVVQEMHLEDIQNEQYSDYIWQEFIDSPDEEYTCGLFRSRGGEIRSIILRRHLEAGITSRGEVINDESISQLLTRIAEGLELVGSINVQLRNTAKGPLVFEINPRFSSTVVFRHLLGFKDVLWSLYDAWDMKLDEYTAPHPPIEFYRIAQEIIIRKEGEK